MISFCPPQHNVSDEEIQQVTADNLDVACQVIEKVATDKAILEIDNSLASAYEARRRHREVRNLQCCQFEVLADIAFF